MRRFGSVSAMYGLSGTTNTRGDVDGAARGRAAQWDATLATYAEPTIGSLPVHAIDTAVVMQSVGARGSRPSHKPLPLPFGWRPGSRRRRSDRRWLQIALTLQRRKPNVRTPPIRQLTAVSRPLSPISDAMLRRARPAARMLEVDSDFTISAWIARGGQSNSHLQIEGLRKAGLPE